jgi:hypothetical protein
VAERALVITREGREVGTLLPGGVYRIGRHEGNDVVIDHDTVSRFHVRLTWAKDLPRPQVRDEGSHNGTWLGGQRLDGGRVLPHDAAVLKVGEVELHLELRAALLDDVGTGERMTLFSDEGPELAGSFDGEGLSGVLLPLELQRRTGTLTIMFDGKPLVLTLYTGKLMGAEGAGLSGLSAVRLAAGSPAGTKYMFVREFEPQANPIGRWPSDVLRSLKA